MLTLKHLNLGTTPELKLVLTGGNFLNKSLDFFYSEWYIHFIKCDEQKLVGWNES